MSFAFDVYIPAPSPVHRLDPRVKLVLLVLGVIALLSLHNVFVCCAWLALNQALFRLARIPWLSVRRLWQVMWPLSVMVAVTWPLFSHEGTWVLVEWGWFKLTALSVVHGVALAARLNALAQLYFVLLFTTDQMVLVRGLVQLGLPFEWGLTLSIALRYVPTFFGTFQMITEAQQARGVRLKTGSWLQRLRAYSPILIAMIITAVRTAEHLARALEARALGASPWRTTYKPLRFQRADGLVLLCGGFAMILVFGARLLFGFGAHPFFLWQ